MTTLNAAPKSSTGQIKVKERADWPTKKKTRASLGRELGQLSLERYSLVGMELLWMT